MSLANCSFAAVEDVHGADSSLSADECEFVDAVYQHCKRLFGSDGAYDRLSCVGVAVGTFRRITADGGVCGGVRELCRGSGSGGGPSLCVGELGGVRCNDVDDGPAGGCGGGPSSGGVGVPLSGPQFVGSLERSVELGVVSGGPEEKEKGAGFQKRGPNFEKNKRSRELKKERKAARAAAAPVPLWRRGAVPVSADQRGSFFSQCDDQTKRALRESRAKMLIAKNKREAAEAEAKVKRLESVSPEASLVANMIKVTRMANQLKRQTKDEKIGGWAETVADSLTRSVAESAPSSVPSLESVGYGKSALKSSSGSGVDSNKSIRQIEYEMALQSVEAEFDNLEVYSEDHRQESLREVREYYADVSKTPDERIRDDVLARVSAEMGALGIGFQHIEDIVERVKENEK